MYLASILEAIFDQLIDSYLATNVGTVNNFLSGALSSHLVNNINALYSSNLLLSAGTGNNKRVNHNKLVRSDKIYWLDREHNNLHERFF